MALLNGMYLYVRDEQVTREIETAAHPVETGIDITDHVKRKPVEISLTGEIVGESAPDILEQVARMNQTGVVITYVGRNYFKNGQIIDFSTEHTNEIWGGCSFDMVIREVRFARSSYDPNAGNADTAAGQAGATHRSTGATQQAGLQQRAHHSTSGTVSHTTKPGETVQTIARDYKGQGAAPASVRYTLAERRILENDSAYIPSGYKIDVGRRKGV